MGFSIYMLFITGLIPVIMIGFGSYYAARGAPKEITGWVGYRTVRSMENQDTWQFAHKYVGKLWRKWGWWMLFTSAAVMLLAMGIFRDMTGIGGAALVIMQLVPVFLSIYHTEQALKRNFDDLGNRKRDDDA